MDAAPGTVTAHCNPAVFPVPDTNNKGNVAVLPEIEAVPTLNDDPAAKTVPAKQNPARKAQRPKRDIRLETKAEDKKLVCKT